MSLLAGKSMKAEHRVCHHQDMEEIEMVEEEVEIDETMEDLGHLIVTGMIGTGEVLLHVVEMTTEIRHLIEEEGIMMMMDGEDMEMDGEEAEVEDVVGDEVAIVVVIMMKIMEETMTTMVIMPEERIKKINFQII